MSDPVALGPNGEAMLSLTATEKAANEQQAAVYLNGLHDNADTTFIDGKLKRDKIKDDEMVVTDVKLDAKNITSQWAIPAQIPSGPHAGKWFIVVPADARRMNERDLKTGEEKGKDHPAWKSPEIVELDPAWFPVENP